MTVDPLVRDLHRRREAAGLRQADVAASIGTRQSAISEWERGSCVPVLATLRRWAAFFGADVVLRETNATPNPDTHAPSTASTVDEGEPQETTHGL